MIQLNGVPTGRHRTRAWRTELEINPVRQEELKQCMKNNVLDVEKGIYSFKGMRLNRADVEWLLATHDAGQGPVDWANEQDKNRTGLDVRGADLRQVDLQRLPLTKLCGGLAFIESRIVTEEQRKMAAVQLEGANLREAQLEGANLNLAQLEGADLAADITLSDDRLIGPRLADVQWGNINLTVVGLWHKFGDG